MENKEYVLQMKKWDASLDILNELWKYSRWSGKMGIFEIQYYIVHHQLF